MNRIEFNSRAQKGYKYPVMQMNVVSDDGKILDTSYIMLDDKYGEFVAYTASQCINGHSPTSSLFCASGVGSMAKKDAHTVILGQLMLCIADHLFIIDDLLHIEVKIPNIGGRCNKPVLSEFVDKVYDFVKYR